MKGLLEMKYRDFEGEIEELVNIKLREIEEKENIKIIHAIESGSRAWGFASPDSDYDVRFIYIRPKEYYLKLEPTKDFIEWQLDETLDINGWDLSKALKQFQRSNATLFEWSNSPIIYKTTSLWSEIYHIAEKYFSLKASMYHYYGTANSNYYESLQDEEVKYKKYFYVIRPLLACKWIMDKQSPPPVLFSRLTEEELDVEMKPIIEKLIEIKTNTQESGKGKKIEALNKYIEESLAEYKELIDNKMDDKNPDWGMLNELFISCIEGKNY